MVDEVGKDVVRFTMLTRKADAQMDFDFAKVVEASKDNPVFYVQYAHARISSLHRKAKTEVPDLPAEADLTPARRGGAGAGQAGRAIPADRRERGRGARAAPRSLSTSTTSPPAFHAQWNKGNDDPARRFLVAQDPALTRARLELAAAIGQIVRNGLGIMGVAAAEEMA